MDGESYHGLITSLNSQQRQAPTQPWQGYPMQPGQMPFQEEEQDSRRSIFSLFGGKGNDNGKKGNGNAPAQRRPERRGK